MLRPLNRIRVLNRIWLTLKNKYPPNLRNQQLTKVKSIQKLTFNFLKKTIYLNLLCYNKSNKYGIKGISIFCPLIWPIVT